MVRKISLSRLSFVNPIVRKAALHPFSDIQCPLSRGLPDGVQAAGSVSVYPAAIAKRYICPIMVFTRLAVSSWLVSSTVRQNCRICQTLFLSAAKTLTQAVCICSAGSVLSVGSLQLCPTCARSTIRQRGLREMLRDSGRPQRRTLSFGSGSLYLITFQKAFFSDKSGYGPSDSLCSLLFSQ